LLLKKSPSWYQNTDASLRGGSNIDQDLTSLLRQSVGISQNINSQLRSIAELNSLTYSLLSESHILSNSCDTFIRPPTTLDVNTFSLLIAKLSALSSLDAHLINRNAYLTYNQSLLKKADDRAQSVDNLLKSSSFNDHSTALNSAGTTISQSSVGSTLWRLLTSNNVNVFKNFDSTSDAKFYFTPARDVRDVYWRNRILLRNVGWGDAGSNIVPQEPKPIVFDLPKQVPYTEYTSQAAVNAAPAVQPTARTRVKKQTLPSQDKNVSFSSTSAKRR
jgi:hypothetical protein